MNRVLLLVSISAALAVAVVACSQNEDTPTPPPADPVVAPPTPEEPPVPEEAPTPEEPPEAAQTGTGEDQSDLDCEADDVTCPMFDWMEANTVPAVEDHDLPALAKALHSIELMVPAPSYDEGEHAWVAMAREAATKAEAGDFRGARAACKGCHRAWRDQFRQEGRRTAPMPELPESPEQETPTP